MDLVPGHPSYLFTPLARKDQELNDGSVGAADLPGAAQDPCQLLIGKHSVTGGSLERGFDANARRGFQDRAANTPAEEPLDCLEQLVSRMIPPSSRRFENQVAYVPPLDVMDATGSPPKDELSPQQPGKLSARSQFRHMI